MIWDQLPVRHTSNSIVSNLTDKLCLSLHSILPITVSNRREGMHSHWSFSNLVRMGRFPVQRGLVSSWHNGQAGCLANKSIWHWPRVCCIRWKTSLCNLHSIEVSISWDSWSATVFATPGRCSADRRISLQAPMPQVAGLERQAQWVGTTHFIQVSYRCAVVHLQGSFPGLTSGLLFSFHCKPHPNLGEKHPIVLSGLENNVSPVPLLQMVDPPVNFGQRILT